MSMLITENGKFYTVTEYMLSESILPRSTPYGADKDASDKKVKRDGPLLMTIVKHRDYYFLVYVNEYSGTVGFGTSDKWSGHWTTKSIEEFEESRHDVGAGALKAFNKVFYVILELAKKSKNDKIKFDAADRKLGVVYDRMVKNKKFLEYLDNNNWKYIGKEHGNYYTFVKEK